MKRLRRSTSSQIAVLTAICLLASMVVAASASASAPNLTWTGRAAWDSEFWSTGGNWQNGVAPTSGGNYDVLTFGDLGNACNDGNSWSTCYYGYNDLPSLNVEGVDIDDTGQYDLEGGTIAIGSAGITATPGPEALTVSARTRPAARTRASLPHARLAPHLTGHFYRQLNFSAGQVPYGEYGTASLQTPVTLSAAQNWTVAGVQGTFGGNGSTAALELASVSGDYPLTVALSDDSELYVDGNTETGPLAASGQGTVVAGESMNATSGGQVTLNDGAQLAFVAEKPHSGPLDVGSGGSMTIFGGVAPEPALKIEGSYTAASTAGLSVGIDDPGTTPGKDFSQAAATGGVTIGGDLHLYQGYAARNYSCKDLKPGNVDTIISGSSLTGTFANAPNGATVKIKNRCDDSTKDATAVINYTADSVTATIKSGGNAGKVPVPVKGLRIKGKLQVGHTLTVTRAWAHKPTSLVYRWSMCGPRGCGRIKDATDRYKLAPKDAGAYITIQVKAANSSGSSSAYLQTRGAVRKARKRAKH